MTTKKKWIVRFVAGNPEIFSKVLTESGSPMMRNQAMTTVAIFESRGWRGWVEDTEGNRIYETSAEKHFKPKT